MEMFIEHEFLASIIDDYLYTKFDVFLALANLEL